MFRKIFNTIIFLCGCILLAGCGKNELKTGDNISDIYLAGEGYFSEVVIDTSLLPDSLSQVVSFAGIDYYTYVLNCYDSVSFNSEIYFVKFDVSGKILEFKNVEIPLSVFGGDLAGMHDIMLDDIMTVNYFDFFFESDGSFSCKSYLSSNSDSYSIDPGYYSNDILFKWDENGNCISVSSFTGDDSAYSSSSDDKVFTGNDGRIYKTTDSGIVLIDSDGSYVSNYFDFINSDVPGLYFNDISVMDNDHFSGIYRDLDGKYVLSCFERSADKKISGKVLVFACNDIDFDLKRDVIEYNNANKNIRIAVFDYSDRSSSCSSSEGWALLKDDIISGFRPDMIIDSTGYDSRFISYLSDNSMAADLKGVISGCFDKKEKKFNDKAEQLFYSGSNSYALIPSYYYRTIVGRPGLFGSEDEFGYDDFVSTIYPLADNHEAFTDDSREAFIDRLLAYKGNGYVNYLNKSAEFNSDEFITYLQYAGNLPVELSDFRLRYSDVPGYFWGDPILYDMEWNNIGDTQLSSIRNCLGEYRDYGFPASSSEGSGVISATRSYMILSTNAYTNECWDFIKKYMSDEYQDSLTDEIPVTDEGYNIWRELIGFYVMDDSALYYFKDGQQYPIDVPDEETINYIENSINSCNNLIFSDYKVESIVHDYAQQYFDGQITAEEAAALIDRDVEAYLAS